MDIVSSRQNPIVRACRELADTPDPAGVADPARRRPLGTRRRCGRPRVRVDSSGGVAPHDRHRGRRARQATGNARIARVRRERQGLRCDEPCPHSVRNRGDCPPESNRRPSDISSRRWFRPGRRRCAGSREPRRRHSRCRGRRGHRRPGVRSIRSSLLMEGASRQHGQRAPPANRVSSGRRGLRG